MKRLCCVCGEYVNDSDARRANIKGSNVAILLSSLVVFAGKDVAEAKRVYEQRQPRKPICEQHFVTVAQYIGAEIRCAGKAYSQHLDQARGVMVAHVLDADVPEHLLTALNDAIGKISVRTHHTFVL
ncbi:hypothetical protein Y032_0043g743 [Ancylostoma ceylanicum]|uniref:Uncharacterized protein n=1 Tax=Ancylostoma ceylanicum TaxID=53326 RepID=A0A016UEC0_9BILA|nr:hypothetical protein Y032_0043g743 [Ancylostoma ceylanicum]